MHPMEQHIIPAMFGRRHIRLVPVRHPSHITASANHLIGEPITDRSCPWEDSTMDVQTLRCKNCFRVISPAVTGRATICPPDEWCTCEHPVHARRK